MLQRDTCVIISRLASFYKRALPMLLRDPQPDPEFRRKFNELETQREHPAIPKESSFSGTLGWHNSLPQIRKPDYPPEWDKPQKKQIDIEKMAARITWACMGIFAFVVMLVFMLKIIGMVVALK